MDFMLNIAEIIDRSNIYGPGTRLVIWVQGCLIRCPGCWNVKMQSMEIKQMISVDKLTKLIISTEGIEGITILGGEPLHQSEALLQLALTIKKQGLTLMLYTGYENNEIVDDYSKQLVAISDIVVMGRYKEELRSTHLKWRGSTNQSILFHNEKYQHLYEKQEEENQVEIHIFEKGDIVILGYPSDDLVKEVLK
jgi:anaerobic ribonucleoside-triphosphate reductase activating protein